MTNKQKEAVEHPAHYAEGRSYEPIDVIRDWDLNFNLGSSLKYIARMGRKDDAVQDLKKAVYYIQHEIKSIEKIKNETSETKKITSSTQQETY